jgi:vacuolar protein-sorting-associated protein 4
MRPMRERDVQDWPLSQYRYFYETKTQEAEELVQEGDPTGALEILHEVTLRLIDARRQFSEIPQVVQELQSWSRDVRTRITLAQSGRSTVEPGFDGAPTAVPAAPLAAPANPAADAAAAKVDGLLDKATHGEHEPVLWEDIIGIDDAVQGVREAVEIPYLLPQFFTGARAPWRGVLLYGPPGTGKTMLGKAAATAVDSTFFYISAADLTSKWLGEGEKLVQGLFAAARANAPAIIFIDELDSILTQRKENEHDAIRRLKTQFFVEMEGFAATDKVTVIGATNCPWDMDDAAIGRFEKRVYVPLPSPESLAEMLWHKLKAFPHRLTREDCNGLASYMRNYSGRDVRHLVSEVAMEPVRATFNAKHFVKNAEGDWAPCADGTPGCITRPPNDEMKHYRFVDYLTAGDLRRAIAKRQAVLTSERLAKYQEYERKLRDDR